MIKKKKTQIFILLAIIIAIPISIIIYFNIKNSSSPSISNTTQENEKNLPFSYKQYHAVATNEYYDSSILFSAEAYLGDNIAYSLDYNCPAFTEQNTLVKLPRTLSTVGTAALLAGYPVKSEEELQVNSREEALLATQFAIWCLTRSVMPNDTQKSEYICDMDNFVAADGYEESIKRVKSAAGKIIEYVLANPYKANPKFAVENKASVKIREDKTLLIGPFFMNGSGYDITDISVEIKKSPDNIIVCDENGNEKNSYMNGENIYFKIDAEDAGCEIYTAVTARGKHYAGVVYGTGNDTDGKADYCFLKAVEDRITAEMTINVPNLKGSICVIQKDQYDMPLSGITAELKDTSGNVLQTQKSDQNGEINFTEVKIGKYTITVTGLADGYIMMNTPTEIEVSYDHTANLTCVHRKIEGGLKIVALDREQENRYAGTVFEILDADRNVVDTIETNKDGEAVSKKLSMGTYYYREISVPDEIYQDTAEHEFQIKDANVTLVKELLHYRKSEQ